MGKGTFERHIEFHMEARLSLLDLGDFAITLHNNTKHSQNVKQQACVLNI